MLNFFPNIKNDKISTKEVDELGSKNSKKIKELDDVNLNNVENLSNKKENITPKKIHSFLSKKKNSLDISNSRFKSKNRQEDLDNGINQINVNENNLFKSKNNISEFGLDQLNNQNNKNEKKNDILINEKSLKKEEILSPKSIPNLEFSKIKNIYSNKKNLKINNLTKFESESKELDILNDHDSNIFMEKMTEFWNEKNEILNIFKENQILFKQWNENILNSNILKCLNNIKDLDIRLDFFKEFKKDLISLIEDLKENKNNKENKELFENLIKEYNCKIIKLLEKEIEKVNKKFEDYKKENNKNIDWITKKIELLELEKNRKYEIEKIKIDKSNLEQNKDLIGDFKNKIKYCFDDFKETNEKNFNLLKNENNIPNENKFNGKLFKNKPSFNFDETFEKKNLIFGNNNESKFVNDYNRNMFKNNNESKFVNDYNRTMFKNNNWTNLFNKLENNNEYNFKNGLSAINNQNKTNTFSDNINSENHNREYPKFKNNQNYNTNLFNNNN